MYRYHCVADRDSLALFGQDTNTPTLWTLAMEVESVGTIVDSVVHQLLVVLAVLDKCLSLPRSS